MTAWLEIRGLKASVDDKSILNGLDLTVGEGEIHAVMGPNGAGKSTLFNVLCGNPHYQVTAGEVLFKGKNLLEMSVDERAREGLFLAFQLPVEIPGISMATFMKYALNAGRRAKGLKDYDVVGYMKHIKVRSKALGVTDEMMKRPVNVGFSGGEKKRMEMFQMAVLEPSLCMVDEMDSGLDVDALKVVADAINVMRSPERSFMLISHNRSFLESVGVDKVHVLVKGRLVKTGGADLLDELTSFSAYQEAD